MRIGYARVSTGEQNLDLQRDALEEAGCERVFSDEMSGAKAERPGLRNAIDFAREGDVLVVWRLDRLGRSLRELFDRITELQDRGVGFESLTESTDTTTPGGQLVFHIFGALAEFERNLLRERTLAGLAAARKRGRTGGRPAILSGEQVQLAARLLRDAVRQRLSYGLIHKRFLLDYEATNQ